jgi:tRNA 2-thiouridine synthesizing protein A
MTEVSETKDIDAAERLIRDLERLRGAMCASCGDPLGSHHALLAIAMGFGDAPRCVSCLARALKVQEPEFQDSLLEYVRSRECYLGAWNWANRKAGLPENVLSPIILKSPHAAGGREAALFWDAGEMGCGELILELRVRMRELRPGEVLKLCARDPGAHEDLPAWCRLTGHGLVRAEHPFYWIKGKE